MSRATSINIEKKKIKRRTWIIEKDQNLNQVIESSLTPKN